MFDARYYRFGCSYHYYGTGGKSATRERGDNFDDVVHDESGPGPKVDLHSTTV